MTILVLNGSPKGDNSVTMSYIKYLEIVFPEHDFKIRHIAQTIHRLEKDNEKFEALMDEIRQCDVVLWAFPLYFMLVHSNYKRFIELLFERNQQAVFFGKYTASLSTSIHFYDHTAHNYLQGICEDLGMHFVESFSAEMHDLMDEHQRQNLRVFMENIITTCNQQVVTTRVFPRLIQPSLSYQPSASENRTDLGNLKLVILTDSGSMSDNLRKMLESFRQSFFEPPEVIDLEAIKIAGGCLGCLKCGIENKCAYDGKDDVRTTYEDNLKKADIVIFALTMKDRYFSARWKNFLDRRFYKTHQPGFPGKQIGYLVSGPLSYEQNLRQILQALSELDQANLVDVITDEFKTSSELDQALSNFAEKLLRYATIQVKKPQTFLGVGGAKIFRDEMWGDLRFVFQADYRYFKKHGMIDFPQSKLSTRMSHLLIPLTKLDPIKKQIQDKTKDMMHRPHDLVNKHAQENRLRQEQDSQ